VVGKEVEVSTPLLENILNQAKALQKVADTQLGEGRAALTQAAALLQSKQRIVLSGMGASFFACIPLQYMLAARGYQAAAIETGELLYFCQALIDSNTVVVLVSRSGESVEVTKLVAALRRRGASIIGVVNVPESALASAADRAIVIGSPPDQMVAVQTYTGTVALLALLGAAVFNELEMARDELQKTIELLARWIPECVASSERWRAFLEGDAPLYLLGRGPASGAVTEGVLLMHETAKLPAVGMSVAQFRHGPVEVTDTHFCGIVIGTQPVTAELDVALAEDLTKMGGQVRWIGPLESGSKIIPLQPWPDGVSDRFAPILEVIPLQVLAYRKAEWRGIRPGDFRWAPLVTRSEAGFSTPNAR
jgi:glutamine---fructose-6-phosphate transaminase (isomerizing)